MATVSRRAVITGFGVLSPIGNAPDALWSALLAGTRGVRRITLFDPSHLPSQIAGEVADFQPRQMIEKSYRRTLNAMARTVSLGVVGCQWAMADAGLSRGSFAPTRCGIEFASVMGATELDDLGPAAVRAIRPDRSGPDMRAWGEQGIPEIPPLWMLKYLPNMPACHATILYDIQGPSNTQILGDVAGASALEEALRILRRQTADIMLVGGSEAKVHPLSLSRFNLFAEFSRRNDDPGGAIRPFDRERDGTAPGEGAAVFVLEALEHARQRGATPYAEVVAVATGVDRSLSGQGLARIIRQALALAGITPDEVDHVNAHGLGTRSGDRFEARGIAEVFGSRTPVFAPLSRFGNLGAASALLELACSVLALRQGLLPPTLNHLQPDPECPIHVHVGEPRPIRRPYVVKTTYTDLGQCAAIVIRRAEA
ncbi:MAG: beta-ketoacyl-[acyl-carrier-protein] synthase family protein [Gemmataceae bacterium]|nr:beta-ketoacyl-[acyl-carrier-protein] synthase family protein [Gemmataceae bacterium]